MVIRYGGKCHQAVRLKLCDSHLTCKVANKCLNICEQEEVVEWNKHIHIHMYIYNLYATYINVFSSN